MKKAYFLTLVAMLFCCLGMNAAAELTFSNVSLAPGSQIASLAQDQQITFNTNMDAEIGYMYADIKDNTTNSVVLSRTTVYDPNFNNDGNGQASNMPQNKKEPHFTFVCPVETKLFEDHTYTIIFYAFASKDDSHGSESNLLAQGSLEYKGATPGYIGSRFKLLSVSPDLSSFAIKGTRSEVEGDASKRSVTLNFSGKVRMDKEGTFINTGFGTSASLQAITPAAAVDSVITITAAKTAEGKDTLVRDTAVYCSSWTLTPRFSTISDGANVIFVANAFDKAGLHVSEGTEYSTGASETSYYTFTVENEYGAPTFDLVAPEADDASVNSLYSFVVSEKATGLDLSGTAGKAVLYQVKDGKKTKVAEIVNRHAVISTKKSSDAEIPTSMRLFLDTPISAAGEYVLHFPSKYFIMGSGMTAPTSASADYTFTLKKALKDAEVKVVSPAEDAKINSLSSIRLKYSAWSTCSPNPDETVDAYVFKGNDLITAASVDMPETGDLNDVVIKLKKTITAPGTYTLIVPENAVVRDNEGMMAKPNVTRDRINPDDDDYLDYYNCGAFIHDFTVEAAEGAEVKAKLSIENNSTVDKIEELDITFEGAYTVNHNHSMLKWVATNKKNNIFAMMDEVEGNVVAVHPTKDMWDYSTITAADTYTITFPAGTFTVDGKAWPEITLTVTVGSSTGIGSVEGDASASAKSVYTLTGVKVDAAKAKNGAYIVNGKKVILK